MKIAAIFSVILVVAALGVSAQQPTPQPPLPPPPQPTPTTRMSEIERIQRLEQQRQQADIKKLLAGGTQRDAEMRQQANLIAVSHLYRRSTEAERAFLAPAPELYAKYADILRLPQSGLVRLVANLGCTADQAVVTLSAACLQYSMPGAGNSYSFRIGDHQIRRLADITLTSDRLEVTGQLSLGIMADLGAVDLRSVSIESEQYGFLTAFKPPRDLETARQLEQVLRRGVTSAGVNFKSSAAVAPNSTYLMRSIAYNANYLRAYKGTTFNELSYDRRLDLIIAFQIVDRSEDGGVTLLWREISRKKSPRIKLK
jgi:hypothetical protein